MAYWDTSCLVKLYSSESDSTQFKEHVIRGASLLTSEIARLELFATLQRKEAEGHLPSGGARQSIAAYDADVLTGLITVMPLDQLIIKKFESIVEQCHQHSPPIWIRTFDAIHLATAAISGESEIVATDKRLREAALSLGLSIFPPP